MFDVQVRGYGAQLPLEILDSIASYYRRVTTTAHPMSRLVAAFMVVTLGALIGEIALSDATRWEAILSLAFVAIAVGVAASRTVPSAVRLGARTDGPQLQSALARSIYRDHLLCFALIAATVILQVTIS
jgi:hypothetical protein